jgi:hypothetical protein
LEGRVRTIQGRVTDEEGRAVADAVVLFIGDSPPHHDIAAMTDSDGAFRFGELVPGRYTVSVNAEGFATGTATVELDNGDAQVAVALVRK